MGIPRGEQRHRQYSGSRRLENAGAIAAVPGIDALLVGTNDLTIEMGIPGQTGHARVAEAYETVLAACSAHGVYPGLGGVYQRDLMARYVGMGFRLILAGNDLPFMMSAAREQSAFLRSLERS